ncbi:hypothetical protein JXA40_09955 [bacterium]|nr:hypothetical protein [candidate division CSSED10-310 bacterium]
MFQAPLLNALGPEFILAGFALLFFLANRFRHPFNRTNNAVTAAVAWDPAVWFVVLPTLIPTIFWGLFPETLTEMVRPASKSIW